MADLTVTARSAGQRDALDWMMGKPLPEGLEHLDLPANLEWAAVLPHANIEWAGPDDGGGVRRVAISERWVDAWWDEVADGWQIGAGQADTDPDWAAHARTLARLAARYGIDVDARAARPACV